MHMLIYFRYASIIISERASEFQVLSICLFYYYCVGWDNNMYILAAA
jgi:hypothetical protein